MTLRFRLDGREVEVPDDGESLLVVLRDRLGVHSPKDGCSPQGQCGCCTVLVDGAARVACVTPGRRVDGREVTTIDGLPEADRNGWADRFTELGASQCGFCTPGIIMRLHALPDRTPTAVRQALLAHLCRCTGWQTIVEAGVAGPDTGPVGNDGPPRDLTKAALRAALEGGVSQQVGRHVALGQAGFADDTAPADALVAVSDEHGSWAIGETLAEAKAKAGKVQGRRSGGALAHPIEVPPGDWDVTLRTTWVEPAYVESDASWCLPGGEPASAVANGGAFGGKANSPAAATARRLADEHGRAVRVVLSREDTVRTGPKRPPVAAGVRHDGTGVLRIARTEGVTELLGAYAPGLRVEEVDVIGPPTSLAIRGAGWVEAAVLQAVVDPAPITVTAPNGARASAAIDDVGTISVEVACGEPLDDIVLRSYCIGAAHMALGWVTSEGIALDEAGVPVDLTIRSFGILRAKDMPEVRVTIAEDERPPMNGSDAVFAAVAAAAWQRAGLVQDWPISRV